MGTQSTSKYLKLLNLNPEGKDISDCSTRTLCYCMDKDYSEIRELQNSLSELLTGSKSSWNSFPVLEVIMLIGNWIKITFFKRIPRWKVALMLNDKKMKILTESSGHVAAIHSGKVVDTWDSTRGRVYSIIVPSKNLSQIKEELEKNSIQYVISG